MKLPIQRIDEYTVPASGSVAQDVERYVAGRVAYLVADLPDDPVLEVGATPLETIEVMIFASRSETKTRLEEQTERIRQELRAMGVSAAFYVSIGQGYRKALNQFERPRYYIDAMADVTIRIRQDNDIYAGRGANTDIIVWDSARAYAHALNKLLARTTRSAAICHTAGAI